MHIESKFYKFQLLEKFVVQHGIKAWFDGKSWVFESFLCNLHVWKSKKGNLYLFVCLVQVWLVIIHYTNEIKPQVN